MKTITITEFEALASNNNWQRKQEHEVVDRTNRQTEKWNEEKASFEQIDIPCAWGWATKISTLDEIKITYTESFNYDEYEPDSLSTGTEGQHDVWSVEGVVVVDEDGEELNAHELSDYLNSDFSSIDYNALEIEQTTDIDVDESSGMEVFTLEINNAPSLRFTGELVASAASSDNQAMGSSYSGQTGRWTELALYKTTSGKFVCHQIGRTRWEGENDNFNGKVCETIDEVKEFFGHQWLAQELYDSLAEPKKKAAPSLK